MKWKIVKKKKCVFIRQLLGFFYFMKEGFLQLTVHKSLLWTVPNESSCTSSCHGKLYLDLYPERHVSDPIPQILWEAEPNNGHIRRHHISCYFISKPSWPHVRLLAALVAVLIGFSSPLLSGNRDCATRSHWLCFNLFFLVEPFIWDVSSRIRDRIHA